MEQELDWVERWMEMERREGSEASPARWATLASQSQGQDMIPKTRNPIQKAKQTLIPSPKGKNKATSPGPKAKPTTPAISPSHPQRAPQATPTGSQATSVLPKPPQPKPPRRVPATSPKHHGKLPKTPKRAP